VFLFTLFLLLRLLILPTNFLRCNPRLTCRRIKPTVRREPSSTFVFSRYRSSTRILWETSSRHYSREYSKFVIVFLSTSMNLIVQQRIKQSKYINEPIKSNQRKRSIYLFVFLLFFFKTVHLLDLELTDSLVKKGILSRLVLFIRLSLDVFFFIRRR
jgi:hypothetical protein